MTDKELYKLCCEYGAKAKIWKKKFVALLPEIARREIHKDKGFPTMVEFAAKVGGVSKYTVQTVFQVENHVHDKPIIKNLIPEVGIHKVKVIATIATKENQEELAKKVVKMSKPALEKMAQAIRQESKKHKSQPRLKKREHLSFNVDEDVALELKKFKQKLGTVEWNDVMKKLLDAVKEKPKKTRKFKKTKITRQPSAQEKREAYKKYNGGCAFPGCNKPSTELHHPDRYALNKSHERLTPLCDCHHELAHHGLIGNEEKPPEMWFVRQNPDPNDPKFKIDQKMIQHKMAFT